MRAQLANIAHFFFHTVTNRAGNSHTDYSMLIVVVFYGLVGLAALIEVTKWVARFMTPAEWRIFFRNLIGLYTVEALIVGFVDWKVPAFRGWYVVNWHFVWAMCFFFTPAALVGRIEEIRMESYFAYLNAQRQKAREAAESLLPSSTSSLAS